VAIVAVSSYYQQKQIQGRNPDAEVPPQQKMLMRVFPAMFVVIAFISPSALVVYFVVSNLYRIGMQAYITRSLYRGDDSLGAQAQRASAEAKQLKDAGAGPEPPRLGKKAKAVETSATDAPSDEPPSRPSSGSGGNGTGPVAPTSRTTGSQNRSKKKKKRR
jgi:YidC/Oxa1 family membrane protein insertase